MTRFEYLSVLVSIVIALGISEVTVAWARVFQLKTRTKIFWLHGFWSLFSLFVMIQFWWGFWRYSAIENWTLAALVTSLASVIVLSFCALMLVPKIAVGERFDSESTYFDNASKFFFLGGCFVLLVGFADVSVLGTPVMHSENAFRAIGAIAAFSMAFSKSRRIHAGFAFVGLGLLVGFLVTTNA